MLIKNPNILVRFQFIYNYTVSYPSLAVNRPMSDLRGTQMVIFHNTCGLLYYTSEDQIHA